MKIKSEKSGKFSKKRKKLKKILVCWGFGAQILLGISAPKKGQKERILYKWLKQDHAAKIPINGSILKEKVLEISSQLEMQNFTASKGCTNQFKGHNLSYKFVVRQME